MRVEVWLNARCRPATFALLLMADTNITLMRVRVTED